MYFAIEAIILFVNSIKKVFEWYVHFIAKSIIWTVIFTIMYICVNCCSLIPCIYTLYTYILDLPVFALYAIDCLFIPQLRYTIQLVSYEDSCLANEKLLELLFLGL